MEVKGVDISYCQDGIDYSKLKSAGVKFALIRLSYGISKDKVLDAHVAGCKRQGIQIGYYLYSIATNEAQAIREAEFAISLLKQYDLPSYPVFYDLEENYIANGYSKKVHTACAKAFCDTLLKAGYYSGVYTNPAWLESYYNKKELVGKYDIWLACWTEDPKIKPRYDYGQTIWQWGVDDIGMKVDGNICYINYPAKIDYWRNHVYKPSDSAPSAQTNPSSGTTAALGSIKPTKIKAGTKLRLNKAPIYGASTSTEDSGTLSGDFIIFREKILHNKITITVPGETSVATGWIKLSDIGKTITVVGDPDPVPKPQPSSSSDGFTATLATRIINGEFGRDAVPLLAVMVGQGINPRALQAKIKELEAKIKR